MPAKGLQLVGVGGGQERAAKFFRHSPGGAIAIEPALVEMANLDRVKTVDIFLQPLSADRTANDIEWMRRKCEKRGTPSGAQPADIIKAPEPLGLPGIHIQQDDIRAVEAHLRRGD